MPEAGGANIEIAKHLSEHEAAGESAGQAILEIIEALVLAIVAITTAWSGYQAALWTGHQSELYGQASKLRVQAEGASTSANQERLYNASTVVEWLKAEASNDKRLTTLFERRFLPEFRPAFEAWKKTDPLNNPNAPLGPQLMPQYRSSTTEDAAKLNDQSTEIFEQGNRAGNAPMNTFEQPWRWTPHNRRYLPSPLHPEPGVRLSGGLRHDSHHAKLALYRRVCVRGHIDHLCHARDRAPLSGPHPPHAYR